MLVGGLGGNLLDSPWRIDVVSGLGGSFFHALAFWGFNAFQFVLEDGTTVSFEFQ